MNKKTTIDDATPQEWDELRKHYIRSIEEHEIVCPPKEHVDFPDNIRPNMVDKPPHYNQGGIECIEYIKQQLGDSYEGYLQGNVIKYLHRYKYKNGLEDLNKAKWYLERLIENFGA